MKKTNDSKQTRSVKTKRILSAIAACLTAAMCMPLTSCVTSISATEVSAGYRRQTDESGRESDALWAAMSDLSFKLLGNAFGEDAGNIMISPYSIAMCLGMLTEGADGETRAQLEGLFGMDGDTLSRALYALTERLCADDDATVSVADSIWIRNGSNVKSDFLQRNADWYSAEVYQAAFDATTVKDINKWCSDNTDGMIDKVIDSISADAVMYLINAVCFEAEWQKEYKRSDISDWVFHNLDGSDANVKMLCSSDEKYIEGCDLYGFARNYEGGKFSFVGLLPTDENADIFDVARGLDGSAWLEMWRSASGRANVYIPEFKLEYKTELNDVLCALGVRDVFDPAVADLGGISDNDDIFCSKIEHKTYFELDRQGTRAAAVTYGELNATSCIVTNNKIVNLDRPFIAMIVDNESGMPVFCGVVTSIK